ncbi:MAG: phosphodiester glycosidase family protein [bacterium]|nr:phosphodiester glycosidase family protein [bacterium]
MRKNFIILGTILGLFSILSSMVFANWIPIAPGIEYSSLTIAGPNRIFITRLSRASTNCIIDSVTACGRLNKTGLPYNGRESVSLMANRYDDTINYWGEGTVNYWGNRSQVVAAINGDFYNYSAGTAFGGTIEGGWFAKRYIEYGGSGFVWKLNRTCFLGGDVRNGDVPNVFPQLVAFAQSTATITRLNWTRGTNDLVLYTPLYGPHTYTDNSGVEVVVKMDRPNLPFPQGTSYARGNVVQVRKFLGSTPIPFDSVVFSGHGNKTTLLSQCTVGQEVRVYMHVKDYGTPTTRQYPLPADQDWGKAYAGIGGGVYCVVSSQVPSADWAGNIDVHPRTAVAFNSTYIYFVVVDGRTSNSVGMTYDQLGYFCRDSLGAQFAVNQDGGGSSTLWVKGLGVVNYPSDSSERYVANGLVMVNVLPMSKTSTFYSSATVMTIASTAAHLGPGTNYGIVSSYPGVQVGTVVSHSLNGVFAKGQNWWKCLFGSTEGWVSENQLAFIPSNNSNRFASYDTITTLMATPVRLGPGIGFGIATTIPALQVGTIIPHILNGIYMNGEPWWQVDFGGVQGWVNELSIPIKLVDFEAVIEPDNKQNWQ